MSHLQQHEALESGQGLVEYALILVFIALAVIVSVGLFGDELLNTFNIILDTIQSNI